MNTFRENIVTVLSKILRYVKTPRYSMQKIIQGMIHDISLFGNAKNICAVLKLSVYRDGYYIVNLQYYANQDNQYITQQPLHSIVHPKYLTLFLNHQIVNHNPLEITLLSDDIHQIQVAYARGIMDVTYFDTLLNSLQKIYPQITSITIEDKLFFYKVTVQSNLSTDEYTNYNILNIPQEYADSIISNGHTIIYL